MARAGNSSRRSLVSRLTGRRNRRRRRRDEVRRRVRRVARIGVRVAGVAVLIGCLPTFAAFARSHPYFRLDDVVIESRGHVSDAAVRAAAGLREGMSIWDVDTDVVRRAIEGLPWVRSVRVTRQLPRRVTIRIREHRPAAIIRLADADPPLRYVATNGRIFAPVGEGDGRDLPYLTGIAPARIEAGTATHEIRAAMQALHVAAQYRGAIGIVSEVHVDEAAGITLLPVRPAIPIFVGWGDVDAKLARVAEVLPHWVGRAADVRSIRATEDDQVIVRVRTIPKEWGT
jgi:cell division septal protein FtsQ